MISDDEIKEKSIELDVHTSNVQRDYIFGWLLSGIYHISPTLRDLLILKGGNGFRKAYFRDARYSGDLDFSVQHEVDPALLHSELNKVCEYVGDNTGIKFTVSDTRVLEKPWDTHLYEARLYFRSFYGEEHVPLRAKLDITEFDQILLPIQKRSILHDYSDAEMCLGEISCHQLEELLASKLLALIRRVHSPDLFDFVYCVLLQNDLPVDRLQIVTTFMRKAMREGDPKMVQNLLLNIPFAVMGKFWDTLVSPKTSAFSFDVAEAQFRDIITQIFGLVTGEALGAAGGIFRPGYLTYFSPSDRNLIMEAGRTQTLLRIHYDGLERLVEPYSLVYKVRKDGVGREYFYGWSLQGGRSSGTGIRAYTQDKLKSVTLTDEKFEPRFPIELTKSQDQTTPGYFGRPFSRR